jgi:FkbM family methyltransferase
MQMNLWKVRPSHLAKVVKARRRLARLRIEDRFGLFIRRWPPPGTAAAEIGRLLGTLDVSCVIDVGAHTGGFGRTVRRLGFTGDIVSFEPATATFRELEHRTRNDPSWRVHRLALGAARARMELDIYAETQLNSLRRPPASTGPLDDRPESQEVVDVVRLDDVWADLGGSTGRAFLKIDAQGFDLEVLRGAEAFLESCVAMQVEVSGVAIYDGSPPLHDVLEFLHDRSFHITGLFPIVRHPGDRLQVIDFDATFVKVPVVASLSAT